MATIVILHALVALLGGLTILVGVLEPKPSKRTGMVYLGFSIVVLAGFSFFTFLDMLKR